MERCYVIERQGNSNINRNERCLLQFCVTNGLCIMNAFFWNKEIYNYTWYKNSVGLRSIIDFRIVSADLLSSVVDVRVKRGAELSTNHHLVVCILRDLNCPRTRKRFRAQRAYRIKWELLADKKVRHTFASKVAFLFRELPDFTEDVGTEWNLFNQHSLHLQPLVVVANMWEVKRVVRKELLGETKKLKKLSAQRKLRVELR